MKNTVLTLLVLLVLLAFNQSTFAQASWTEASQIEGLSPVPGNNQVVPAQVIPGDGIDFYTDAALWSGACPVSTSLTSESWSNTLLGPNSVLGCDLILNNLTNDGCFAPGGIVAGIELASIDFTGTVIATTGFVGVPSNAVGPNNFVDNAVINFTLPANSVAFEFITPLDVPTDFIVEFFGASGSLGVATVTSNGNTPVFFGAIASENITSIVFDDQGMAAAELFTNISFDLCEEEPEEVVVAPIPTMGEWGLMVLGIMLLIFGLVAVNQKRSAIPTMA